MPRFAVLEHDFPFPHHDFLLEDGAVLRAWRLLESPRPNVVIRAQAIPDHRPLYLDYEGPVSQDRGTVRGWDRGTFDWLEQGERVRVAMAGLKVKGLVALTRALGEWQWFWTQD